MIVSKNIELKVELPVTTEQIEKGLAGIGIDPVRWAIVEVNGNLATVSVSYEE